MTEYATDLIQTPLTTPDFAERQLSSVESDLVASVEAFEQICRDENITLRELKAKYDAILRVYLHSMTLLKPSKGQVERDKEIYAHLLRLLERAKKVYETRLGSSKVETDSENEKILKKTLLNQRILEIEEDRTFNDIHRIVFEVMKILHWPTNRTVTEIEYTGYEDIKNDLRVIEMMSERVNKNPAFFDDNNTQQLWREKFKNTDLCTGVFQVVLRHVERKK